MIPIRDINPTSRTAWLTLVLIAANVAVFLLWEPTFEGPEEQQEFFFCNAQIAFETTNQTTLADGGAEAREAIVESFGAGESEAAGLQDFLEQTCPDKSWLGSRLRVDVPPRRMAPPRRQHAVPLGLREQRGGPARAVHLPSVLRVGRTGRDADSRSRSIRTRPFPTWVPRGRSRRSWVPTSSCSPRARIHTLVIFFFITFLELPATFVLLRVVRPPALQRGRRDGEPAAEAASRTGHTWAGSSSAWRSPGSSSDLGDDRTRTRCRRRHRRIRTDRDGYAITARR